MIDNLGQAKNFCFLTLGDITEKEELIVETLLSSFDINYFNKNDITNAKDALNLVNDIINYGIKNIIIDIKVGYNISFEEAKLLSQNIQKLSNINDLKIICFITNLNISLGTSFGNNLEMLEIVDVLNGNISSSLAQLSIKIASVILNIYNNLPLEENQFTIINNINNNTYKALKTNNLEISNKMISIKSSKSGFLKNINIFEIEDLLNKLDKNDYKIGIKFSNQIGDYILENEELAKVYLNNMNIYASEVLDCFLIEPELGKQDELIKEIVG